MSEVAVKKGNAVELTPFQKFVKFVQERAELDASFATADELVSDQVARISAAESADDLFGAMKIEGLTGLKDLENGTDIQIHGYRLLKSANAEMSGRTAVYTVMDATDLTTGEKLALDSGIERVLIFLIKCERLEMFPVDVRIIKKQTQTGNTLVTFGKVPARTVKG